MKNYKRLCSFLLACAIIVSTISAFPTTFLANDIHSNKEYVLQTKSSQTLNKILNKYQNDIISDENVTDYLDENNVLTLSLNDRQYKSLSKTDDVNIEEDVQLTASSSDDEIHYDDTYKKIKQWNLDFIEANKIENNSQNHVKVAVIDTGVCATDKIAIAGKINLVQGEQQVEPMYEDASGHGTSIASIIAASDNSETITGINPNAELYSVKALSDNKTAPISRIVEGIYWCIDNNINIINMSFGTNIDSKILHKAIIDAYNKGILMIAAVGNNNEIGVQYPAAYDEVMGVGSIDNNAQISDFSATGNKVEIVAPGEKIASTGFFDELICTQGTSVAAAHVTGVASLLWDYDTSKSSEFIRALLNNSARSIGAQNIFGHGIVDAKYAFDNYLDFEQNYSVENSTPLSYNISELNTYTDSQVKALWYGSGHSNALNSTTYSNNKKVLLQYAVKMSDHVLRGIVNTRYGVSWDDTQTEPTKTYNHYFHGYGNYVADYIFLANCAYYYKNNGSMPSYDNQWQALYPTNNYSNEYPNLKISLEALNYSWDTVYNCLASDTDLSGKLTSSITASIGHNSLILIGIAIHCAMDAYSHKICRNGSHSSDDSTSSNANAYTTAKSVALDILKKWNAGQGSFQVSEFYQPSSAADNYKMENLLSNVLAVKPNLSSISSKKYNWFNSRTCYYTSSH